MIGAALLLEAATRQDIRITVVAIFLAAGLNRLFTGVQLMRMSDKLDAIKKLLERRQ